MELDNEERGFAEAYIGDDLDDEDLEEELGSEGDEPQIVGEVDAPTPPTVATDATYALARFRKRDGRAGKGGAPYGV